MMLKRNTGRFISLVLRHHPEVIGIQLDEHGWAKVDELVQNIARDCEFNREMLEEIVRTDGKQRYSFNDDHTLIRANQGHSIPVDVELPVVNPPEILWHGTGEKYVDSILKQGLLPRTRLYVHLSQTAPTAVTVGRRHGTPVLFKVNAGKMAAADYIFYLSKNGVWLTKTVPIQYLMLCKDLKNIIDQKP